MTRPTKSAVAETDDIRRRERVESNSAGRPVKREVGGESVSSEESGGIGAAVVVLGVP
jgi:hypothetical protein